MNSGIGKITAGATFRGSGFALSPRCVITAAHVVRGLNSDDLAYSPEGDAPISVEDAKHVEKLDAAALTLVADCSGILSITEARPGDTWWVSSRPNPTSPMLTGTVTDVERSFRNSRGEETRYLQLHVDQDVANFRGYSGGAVCVAEPPNCVIGLLVEQHPKSNSGIGPPGDVGNILWAAPMVDVLDELELRGVANIISRESILPWQLDAAMARTLRAAVLGAKNDSSVMLGQIKEANDSLRLVRDKMFERSQTEQLLAAFEKLCGWVRAVTGPSKADQTYLVRAFDEILTRTRGVSWSAAQTPLQAACHVGLYSIAVLAGNESSACSEILRVFGSEASTATRIFPELYKEAFGQYWVEIDSEIDRKIIAEKQNKHLTERALVAAAIYGPAAYKTIARTSGIPIVRARRIHARMPSLETMRAAVIKELEDQRERRRLQCAQSVCLALLGLDTPA